MWNRKNLIVLISIFGVMLMAPIRHKGVLEFLDPIVLYSSSTSLPTSGVNPGEIVILTNDADPPTCTAGGGSTVSICRFNGTSWEPIGDGVGSGGGGGDITSVGSCVSGDCFIDGVVSGTSDLLVFEGNTVDTNQIRLGLSGEPSADNTITIPNSVSGEISVLGQIIEDTELASSLDFTSKTFKLPNGATGGPNTANIGEVYFDNDGCLRIVDRSNDIINICGDKLHYPQWNNSEFGSSDGLAQAIADANAESVPTAVIIPAKDFSSVIRLDPNTLTPDANGCLFTLENDVWLVGASGGNTLGGPVIEIEPVSPPGPPTYTAVFCLEGDRSGIVGLTIRHQSVSAGTCSVTTTQSCVTSADCPGSETCTNPPSAATDASGTTFVRVGRTGFCSNNASLECAVDADCGSGTCTNPSPVYPSNIKIASTNFVGSSYAGLKYTGSAIEWQRGLKSQVLSCQASNVDFFMDIKGHNSQKSNAISIENNKVQNIRTSAIRLQDSISKQLRIVNNTFEPNTLSESNAASHNTIDFGAGSLEGTYVVQGNWIESPDTANLASAIKLGKGSYVMIGNIIQPAGGWAKAITAVGTTVDDTYVTGFGNMIKPTTPLDGIADWHLDFAPFAITPTNMPPDFSASDVKLGDCSASPPPTGLSGDLCVNPNASDPRRMYICKPGADNICDTASEWVSVAGIASIDVGGTKANSPDVVFAGSGATSVSISGSTVTISSTDNAGVTQVGSCSSATCFVDGVTTTNPVLTFEGSTDDAFETVISVTNPTADRTVTIPDVDGEISLLGQTIESVEIADGTIDSVDIKDGAITSAKIFDGTIDSVDIKDGAVTTADIANGTIQSEDLASGVAGDSIRVETSASTFTDVADADFADTSTIDVGRTAGTAGAPDSVTWSVKADSITATELAGPGPTVNTYGDASNVPRISVDADGRITTATTEPVAAITTLQDSSASTEGPQVKFVGSGATTVSLNATASPPTFTISSTDSDSGATKHPSSTTVGRLAQFGDTTGGLAETLCTYSQSGTTTVGGAIDCGPNDAAATSVVLYEDASNDGGDGVAEKITIQAPSAISADRSCVLEDDATPFDSCIAVGSTVDSADIADGSITSADIQDGAVTSAKILDGTIDSVDIKDGTIGAADLGAPGTDATTYASAADETVKLVVDADGRVTSSTAAQTIPVTTISADGTAMTQRPTLKFTGSAFGGCTDDSASGTTVCTFNAGSGGATATPLIVRGGSGGDGAFVYNGEGAGECTGDICRGGTCSGPSGSGTCTLTLNSRTPVASWGQDATSTSFFGRPGSTNELVAAIKSYSSFTLTAGTVTVEDVSTTVGWGSSLWIDVSGDVSITGGTIDLSGKGPRGQGHGVSMACNKNGEHGMRTRWGGGLGGTNSPTAGTAGRDAVAPASYVDALALALMPDAHMGGAGASAPQSLLAKPFHHFNDAGGGGGGSGGCASTCSGTGGDGGEGGGYLRMIVGGTYSCSGATITTAGESGGGDVGGTSYSAGGGGGGLIMILADTVSTNTCTYDASGGAGGAAPPDNSCGAGGAGGDGYAAIIDLP